MTKCLQRDAKIERLYKKGSNTSENMSNLSDLLKTLVEAENVTSGGLGPCLPGSEV